MLIQTMSNATIAQWSNRIVGACCVGAAGALGWAALVPLPSGPEPVPARGAGSKLASGDALPEASRSSNTDAAWSRSLLRQAPQRTATTEVEAKVPAGEIQLVGTMLEIDSPSHALLRDSSGRVAVSMVGSAISLEPTGATLVSVDRESAIIRRAGVSRTLRIETLASAQQTEHDLGMGVDGLTAEDLAEPVFDGPNALEDELDFLNGTDPTDLLPDQVESEL